MKNIITYIEEKLKLSKDSKKYPTIHVKNKEQLKQIIHERLKKDETTIDLTDVDISGIDNLVRLFEGKSSIKSIDVSNWDLTNVKTIDSMFNGCYDLEDIDLSSWDVSNVENMDWVFYNCVKFNSDITMWNVKSVKKTRYMFGHCENFEQDLSSWNIDSKNVEVDNMFQGCTKLKTWPAWYAKK